MTKPVYDFITDEQFEILAECLAGTCNQTPTIAVEYYKAEWNLTETQVAIIEETLQAYAEEHLELFECQVCGWYGHQGELLCDTEEGAMCSDCVEEEGLEEL